MRGDGCPGGLSQAMAMPPVRGRAALATTLAIRANRTGCARPPPLGRGRRSCRAPRINARLPYTMVVDYSAAKSGLTSLTTSLSEEFAPRGVRANAISLGLVRTPFWTAPGGFADTTAAQAGTTAKEAIDVIVPRNMGISTG